MAVQRSERSRARRWARAHRGRRSTTLLGRAPRERRASPARAVLEPRASIARNINRIAFWSRFRCLFGSFGEEHDLVARNRSKKNEPKTSEP